MESYLKLLKLGAFTKNDVDVIYDNRNSAASALKSLIRKGLVKNIRRNLYVCNDIESKSPVVEKFKIGSSISKDAYISHMSALEFHGFAVSDDDLGDDLKNSNYKILKKNLDFDHNNNLRNHDKMQYVFVSSHSRFKTFAFNRIIYQHIALKFPEGVVVYDTNRGTHVTNIERTIIDCIKDMDKAGGIEVFLQSLKRVPSLDNEKLIHYLGLYDIQFLYQKAGFLLEQFHSQFKLPRKFFDICKSKVKSSRYLTNMHEDDLMYVAKWHLFVSQELIFLMKYL